MTATIGHSSLTFNVKPLDLELEEYAIKMFLGDLHFLLSQ